jgi:1-acyl-sn-glycerol-3-phosphate acyltransferase
MGTFKPGAAALCISRDVPCLPVAIVGAAEAMPYGAKWPVRGRPPVYVTFGEPMRAEDGESVAEFSARIAKEVRELIDYTTTYRAEHG